MLEIKVVVRNVLITVFVLLIVIVVLPVMVLVVVSMCPWLCLLLWLRWC